MTEEVYTPIGYVVMTLAGRLVSTPNGTNTTKLYKSESSARGAIRRTDTTVWSDEAFDAKYVIHPVYL